MQQLPGYPYSIFVFTRAINVYLTFEAAASIYRIVHADAFDECFYRVFYTIALVVYGLFYVLFRIFYFVL